MRNLLQETIENLESHGKTNWDVIWCGSEQFGRFGWETFVKLSDRNYDSGFGPQMVARDLLVVGKDFWLERHEYDGREWWEFKKIPEMPEIQKVPRKMISDGYGWDLCEIGSF